MNAALLPPMPRLGQQLGQYRLLEIIGEGGFATIYLGEHVHLGTLAALKVLHRHMTSTEIQKFNGEARTTARLVHANIVRVLDFGLQDDIPYLVMEYAPYGTLRHRHPPGTKLDLTTILQYVRQLARAIHYIHSQGLIHQDIKPENMLVGNNYAILLSDFGIATVASTTTLEVNELVGTVAYMAPEQIDRHPCFASDQYALAVVVYEWLCGHIPFTGPALEIATQHLLTPPVSLQLRANIPAEVDEVVLRALAKDPEQRYASVQEFVFALERASKLTFQRAARIHPAPTYNVKKQTEAVQIIQPQKKGRRFSRMRKALTRLFTITLLLSIIITGTVSAMGIDLNGALSVFVGSLIAMHVITALTLKRQGAFYLGSCILLVAIITGIVCCSGAAFIVMYLSAMLLSICLTSML